MATTNGPRPHLRLTDTAHAIDYRGRTGGRGPQERPPTRNPQAHAAALRMQLAALEQVVPGVRDAQRQLGLDVENGLLVAFESEPEFELAYDSLDLASRGIQLLSVKADGEVRTASVFVPDGELDQFISRIERYAASSVGGARPRHEALVSTIAAIRAATVESLWTDAPDRLPPLGIAVWWEIWLRRSDQIDFVTFARTHAQQLGIVVGPETGQVLDRTVVLVRATREALAAATRLLTGIAEIRSPQSDVAFFTSLPMQEQRDWNSSLLSRCSPADEHASYVCILDTGVNYGHPLLQPLLTAGDAVTYNPAWSPADSHGHGTEMAGVVGYGDLAYHLAGSAPVQLVCRLESSKLIEPSTPHAPHLYGAVTRSAVAAIEIAHPYRRRSFLCAITADACDGTASEWSATVDSLASGAEDGVRRLFVFSAGNADPNLYGNYPNSNFDQTIQDPSQSWNALVVGASTHRWQIDSVTFPGVTPVGVPGALSPLSTTSRLWTARQLKPDVVLEGGNVGVDAGTGWHYEPDSLRVLTTGRNVIAEPLVTTAGTSPASALGAQLAGCVSTGYPDLWPETVRGLIAHSAEWSDQMYGQITGLAGRRQIEALLSVYGYGSPNYGRLMWSADNSLTLLAQSELQPFELRDGEVKFKEMHFHDLPWPTEVLEALGETVVEMRVTLSYFVEPSPGRRGPAARFRYASHGLRFDLRRPTETPEAFLARINAAMDEPELHSASDSSEWLIGSQLRSRGALQSDRWTGTASDLASRDRLAVFPVSGWWRYRRALGRYNQLARYALIVSISAPGVSVDLYTPIANAVAVATAITTS